MSGLRRIVLTVAALLVLPAASAWAQENLDRGKSPQQMFATDCSVCHKSPQGLASKGGILGLQEFLRKHYTASRESAQALADYLAGVGGAPAAKPAAAKKPAQKKDTAKPADGKPSEAKPADTKPAEAKAKADVKKEEAPKAAQPAAASGAAPKNEPFPDVKPAQPAKPE